MKIKIYSIPNCSNCRMVKSLLKENSIEFEQEENLEETIKLSEKYNIISAPVIEIDGKFFNSIEAVKFLREKNVLQ